MEEEIFKALPHVDTIWITDDGHFHLHDRNGGEKISRADLNVDPEKKDSKPSTSKKGGDKK